MSDFEDIERLMRLKRHEKPPEDFVEDFLKSFQQRQRVELMNQSARSLLWERLSTYFEGLFAPKWAMASGTAVAMLGAVFIFSNGAGGNSHGTLVQNGVNEASANNMAPITREEAIAARENLRQDLLLSSHYKGGFVDSHEHERAEALYATPELPQFQAFTPPQGALLPASYSPSGVGFKLDIA